MDAANPTFADDADPNLGLRTRCKFSKLSGTIEMAGPICCDVFFADRLLLSFVDLKVVLNRTSNVFCLVASEDGADYRVKLTDVYLKIRKVKISAIALPCPTKLR